MSSYHKYKNKNNSICSANFNCFFFFSITVDTIYPDTKRSYVCQVAPHRIVRNLSSILSFRVENIQTELNLVIIWQMFYISVERSLCCTRNITSLRIQIHWIYFDNLSHARNGKFACENTVNYIYRCIVCVYIDPKEYKMYINIYLSYIYIYIYR